MTCYPLFQVMVIYLQAMTKADYFSDLCFNWYPDDILSFASGYGDISPSNDQSRVFSLICASIGTPVTYYPLFQIMVIYLQAMIKADYFL